MSCKGSEMTGFHGHRQERFHRLASASRHRGSARSHKRTDRSSDQKKGGNRLVAGISRQLWVYILSRCHLLDRPKSKEILVVIMIAHAVNSRKILPHVGWKLRTVFSFEPL